MRLKDSITDSMKPKKYNGSTRDNLRDVTVVDIYWAIPFLELETYLKERLR